MYDAGVRYEDLVGAAEAVVTKPGYGIISECIANDAAVLYTSRGHFPEYDVLVEEMPKYLRTAFISHDDLFAGKWETHLDKLLAQPKIEEEAGDQRRRCRRGDPAEGAGQAAEEAARTAEGEGVRLIGLRQLCGRTIRHGQCHRGPCGSRLGNPLVVAVGETALEVQAGSSSRDFSRATSRPRPVSAGDT